MIDEWKKMSEGMSMNPDDDMLEVRVTGEFTTVIQEPVAISRYSFEIPEECRDDLKAWIDQHPEWWDGDSFIGPLDEFWPPHLRK